MTRQLVALFAFAIAASGSAPVVIPATDRGLVSASRGPVSGNPPARTQAPLSGQASWYAAPSGTAAAGPSLRAFLGDDWRGSRVSVCGPAGCATVTLTDFMRRDRLVDLNPDAFRAVCGPLSKGVCRVEVMAAIAPPETDTL